ncbi:hypothetical protein [Pseudoxanthomonas sp. JBR18]|uniref:hypothetical protein n=1 Tax=Pseudoxanthomonas sp. JBR18 TaxID=2969308 RepID=UPI00230634E0|nr:hypothetical protein [Pseudoxanthomonas sp. JBR18]WCE03865.1 hypothetical protein PJ250_17530 [Pseudoxanthomonas sp. JBR18]
MRQSTVTTGQVPQWLDLDAERAHWEDKFHTLPCARVGDTFVECWPLIEAVYYLFISRPRATSQEALELYAPLAAEHDRILSEEEMREMFALIWGRLLKIRRGVPFPTGLLARRRFPEFGLHLPSVTSKGNTSL